jgi:glycerol kinase
VIAGLTRATGAGHIARATLEGIAFVVNDLMSAMREDAGRSLTAFKVDGGAAANDLLLQFQADLLNLPIVRPRMIETTAFGAAFLAGLATGVWSSKEEIRGAWKTDRKFVPRMREEERTRHLAKWRRAVAMSCSPP